MLVYSLEKRLDRYIFCVDTMANAQCFNCNLHLKRMKRHTLAVESEKIANTIRLWTYPRDMSLTDQICHSCWLLANQSSSEDLPRRRIGHQHVCTICGRSLSRKDRHVLSASEEPRILNIISNWIQPRQFSPGDETCIPCWRRAQRNALRNAELQSVSEEVQPVPVPDDHKPDIVCGICERSVSSLIHHDDHHNHEYIPRLLKHQRFSMMNQVCGPCWQQAQMDLPINVIWERSQYVNLPNIRRAAETARHCIFRRCMGSERRIVPEETRKHVLVQFQYFIPRGARICTNHLEQGQFEDLYTAEHSLRTFSVSHIEEIIFLLMEGLRNKRTTCQNNTSATP